MGVDDARTRHAFISYALVDAVSADAVQRALERAGVRVWRDCEHIWPGEDWRAKIRSAVQDDALAFVALFSSAGQALSRSRHHEELRFAIEESRQRPPLVPWLVPVRVDDCAIPDIDVGGGRTLGSLQAADLSGADRLGQLRRLALAVAGLAGPREPARSVLPSGESAYLQQVRQIAPPGLAGREMELAELAAFCTGEEAGPYSLWQGGAWAGKSALLSTFVLDPPPGVRVVSFFITARLAAQDTREAFAQVLMEQLCLITGQDLSAVLPGTTRDAFLLDLLARAAERCRDAGERLVLTVDGLDEDSGVIAGHQAHSIAGLLPADPPAGMRVIVSGRPGPPVPDDVPDWHPLRDPSAIRRLDPSPHARVIERLARQELGRLLHGSSAEQDVLGLLTAARGGLSALDLADLAGIELWAVEDIVRSAQGRTFLSRPSQNRPAAAPVVYLLGHEELQATAMRYLARRLPGYYSKLAAWAARWRDAGWPAATPEYLLAGYYQLLTDLGNAPGLIALASDSVRHDRMLDLTGGDAAAITETRAALNLVAAQPDPDLVGALNLAWHRDQLNYRNQNIPTSLPAVWAVLGNTARALALAASIPNSYRQAQALTRVAGCLATAGEHDQAESLARSLKDLGWQARALAHIAVCMADAGQPHRAAVAAARAETVARSITEPDWQAETLAHVTGGLAASRQYDQAKIVARSIISPRWQVLALAQVARSLAAAGRPEQAAAVIATAETAARSVTDLYGRARALAQVAPSLTAAGRPEQAAAVIATAETAARSITDPDWHGMALLEVTGSLAAAGQHDRAETIARFITRAGTQAEALAQVAASLAEAGQYDRAETIARSITSPDSQRALPQVVGSLAEARQYDRAETIACLVTSPGPQAEALAQVARSLAAAGQHDRAAAISVRAETIARSVISPDSQRALAHFAEGLADAGQHDQAEAVIRSITDPNVQVPMLAHFAGSLACAGQPERAETIARSMTGPFWQAVALAQVAESLAANGQYEQAETIARSITEPYSRDEALMQVVRGLAGAGLADRAERVARSIADPHRQPEALSLVAGGLLGIGQHDRAAAVVTDAEAAARSLVSEFWQARALADVAGSLAAAGQHNRAETIARSIASPSSQAEALAQVAGSQAVASRHDQAAGTAAQAEAAARSITDPYLQALTLTQVTEKLAAGGLYGQAETIARSITDPNLQAEALTSVVRNLAETGLVGPAETVAGSISDPDSRAQALAHLALELKAKGDGLTACRITAGALAIGGWQIGAVPAITLDPLARARFQAGR